MNNKENKIDILKEIIKANEELKEQNKKIETKKKEGNKMYNLYIVKSQKKFYIGTFKTKEKALEILNNLRKANIGGYVEKIYK